MYLCLALGYSEGYSGSVIYYFLHSPVHTIMLGTWLWRLTFTFGPVMNVLLMMGIGVAKRLVIDWDGR